MNILVTGGAGYIGSHTVIELQQAGHSVIVVDNLVNGSEESLRRVREITGTEAVFYQADVCDRRGVPFVECLTPLRHHDQWLTDVVTGGGLPAQAGYGLIAWLVLNNGWRAFMGIDG